MLKIVKGGKLIRIDDETKKTKDVTKYSPQFLFEQCVLDRGVTLRDIFLIINKNIEVYDSVLGNWVKEIVKEGLYSKQPKDKELKYLELYWHYEYDEYKNKYSLCGGMFPELHGRAKKDPEIPCSIAFINTSTIIDLPVKFREHLGISDNSEFDINNKNKDYLKTYWEEHYYKFLNPQYTLGQILYGIMWELSFYGPPKDRDKRAKEITKLAEEIEMELK